MWKLLSTIVENTFYICGKYFLQLWKLFFFGRNFARARQCTYSGRKKRSESGMCRDAGRERRQDCKARPVPEDRKRAKIATRARI